MADVAEGGPREDIGGGGGIFRFKPCARKEGRGEGFQGIN
jgi:hypothetical protein